MQAYSDRELAVKKRYDHQELGHLSGQVRESTVRFLLYLVGHSTARTPPFTIQHLFGRRSHFLSMLRI